MTAPLGWLQLKHKPLRLLVALAGIAFAVLLIFGIALACMPSLYELAGALLKRRAAHQPAPDTAPPWRRGRFFRRRCSRFLVTGCRCR